MNDIRPDLTPCPAGWLATTPAGERPRIAVIGKSEDDARLLYARELAAWDVLEAAPERAP